MAVNNLDKNPAGAAPVAVAGKASTVPSQANPQPRRLFLNDVQLPPSLNQVIEDRCRERGHSSRSDREHLEREIKLQHFFGGQDVAYLQTDKGLIIVATGDFNSPEFKTALEALDRTERRNVTLYSPDPWNGSTSSILTPSTHES